MTKKAQYHTQQMKALLTYLQLKQGSHVTVNEVSQYFKSQGLTIGTTTIYRHLERMTKEGTVKKYFLDCSTSACFEYIGQEEHQPKSLCFHCKCESCGKLIHLNCQELETVLKHLSLEHGFVVDPVRTVFYGLCEECRKKNI